MKFIVTCTTKNAQHPGDPNSPINVQFHTTPNAGGATLHRTVKDEAAANEFTLNRKYQVEITPAD